MESSLTPYEQIELVLEFVEIQNPNVNIDYQGTLNILFSETGKWADALAKAMIYFNKIETYARK